jgi:hypothetical protein
MLFVVAEPYVFTLDLKPHLLAREPKQSASLATPAVTKTKASSSRATSRTLFTKNLLGACEAAAYEAHASGRRWA